MFTQPLTHEVRQGIQHLISLPTRPHGGTLYPDIGEFLILLTAFWVCGHYAGDAGDMPHHLLRATAYVVGSWVVFIGVCIRLHRHAARGRVVAMDTGWWGTA